MTVVTQTAPPLKLRRRAEEEQPPTYAMYPMEVNLDLYDPELPPTVHATGIVRKAPYQHGLWTLQPGYAGSSSFIVDLVKEVIWTRSHYPATGQWNEDELMRKLRKFMFPEDARWLHCQKVMTNRKDGTKYATVILDFVHETLTHSERRELLEVCIKQLGVRTKPEHGEVYLVPEFPMSLGEDLWAGLHVMNTDWRNSDLPEPFYAGLVAKQFDATYFVQLKDHQMRTPKWMFHKFSEPYCDPS